MPRSGFLSNSAPNCPATLIAQAATGTPPRVAIARAGAELPMMAAKDATHAGIMTPIFVGEADAINAEADKLNWDISAFAIHDTNGEAEAANTAAALCGSDDADVLMKGHLHTDMFMKGVLTRDNGLRTANRLVHVFHITPPGRDEPLLISDAAVNVSPDIQNPPSLHAGGCRPRPCAWHQAPKGGVSIGHRIRNPFGTIFNGSTRALRLGKIRNHRR